MSQWSEVPPPQGPWPPMAPMPLTPPEPPMPPVSPPPAAGVTGTRRRWLVRGAVAVALGLAIGGAIGVRVVQTLEPGIPGQVDSLTLSPVPRVPAAGASGAPAVDSAATEAPSVAIPDVIGLEEGAARDAVERAGLTVGVVLFRPDLATAGTVVMTFPVPGERVVLPATVNLVLSDGRPPVDPPEPPPTIP